MSIASGTFVHETPSTDGPVIEASGLGKRYGRRWALRDCTLAIPAGKVVGLVGPNGAGKTTLLHLAVGLLAPTAGSISVLDGRPADGPAQLGRVGFVAQDTPVYARMSVDKHLRMGAYLNPNWDRELAASRIDELGLDPGQRAGSLSGGERGAARTLSRDRKTARAARTGRAGGEPRPPGAT